MPPLTAEDEVALARRIEAAELAMREAIDRCPIASAELACVDATTTEPAAVARLDRRALAQVVNRLLGAGQEAAATLAAIESARRDSDAAVKEFATANLRLVVAIARSHRNVGLDFLDLLQEGNTGLMRAVERFDYRRGYRFGTYASWWIRQAMSRAIADKGSTIRQPVHMVEKRRRVEKAAQRLVQRSGRDPSIEEIAAATGLSPRQVRTAVASRRTTTSLDSPMGADGNARLSDFVSDTDDASPEERIDGALVGGVLRRLLRLLTPREQQVIRLRYGLDEASDNTLEEIGRALDLTSARVRQIEVQALRKLKRPAERRHLRGAIS